MTNASKLTKKILTVCAALTFLLPAALQAAELDGKFSRVDKQGRLLSWNLNMAPALRSQIAMTLTPAATQGNKILTIDGRNFTKGTIPLRSLDRFSCKPGDKIRVQADVKTPGTLIVDLHLYADKAFIGNQRQSFRVMNLQVPLDLTFTITAPAGKQTTGIYPVFLFQPGSISTISNIRVEKVQPAAQK